MENFTPVSALIGGIMIGLSGLLLLLAHGRVAGISGILANLFTKSGDRTWSLAFILGLIIGGVVWNLHGNTTPALPTENLTYIIIGGLLVGFGTRLGGGCTSGHGVCGMSRLSPRSIAATFIFMAAAAVTVYVIRHVIGG